MLIAKATDNHMHSDNMAILYTHDGQKAIATK